MLPGPTIVRSCTECHGLIAEYTLGSGNTFGATFWTDGKMDAPMLPDEPALVECPHCRAPLWIEDQEQIGEMQPYERDGPFKMPAQGLSRLQHHIF